MSGRMEAIHAAGGHRRGGRGRRGSALLIALILLMVLSLGSAAAWRAMHLELAGTHAQRSQDLVYFIAEAGLETAIAALRGDPAYPGEQHRAVGEGSFSVSVAREAEGDYLIESTGILGDPEHIRARLTLDARLRLDANGQIAAYRFERRRKS